MSYRLNPYRINSRAQSMLDDQIRIAAEKARAELNRAAFELIDLIGNDAYDEFINLLPDSCDFALSSSDLKKLVEMAIWLVKTSRIKDPVYLAEHCHETAEVIV